MSADGTHPDIPEKSWTNPFSEGTWLHTEFEKRIRQNRDIVIIVDDMEAGRGTGKTVASLQLANGMDQTEEGITEEKATLQPEEIRNAYIQQPRRSALVLDEGEVGASNREAMTNTNKALREIMSMGRVEEKYVIVNTPTKGFIDKDILKLSSVWITMVRKGYGLVHHLRWEPYSERLLTDKKQTIEFKDIPTGTDLRRVYNYLTREKRSRMGGDSGTEYMTVSEHKSRMENREQEIEKSVRDELLREIYNHPEADVGQQVLADCVDLTQSAVSRIVSK